MTLRLDDRCGDTGAARLQPAWHRQRRAEVPTAFPRVRPRPQLRGLAPAEYGRLDANDQLYLDYTGGGLHAASQIDAHVELLRTQRAG